MSKPIITTPFFVVSPKTYISGKDLIELAITADKYAKTISSTIFFTAPPTELINIVNNTKHLVVTAQHADGKELGRGMGRTSLYSLKNIGVKATFLNHMEYELTLKEIANSIQIARELEIITIACCDTPNEAKSLAVLQPDIILCEPNHLIGTGKTSNESYIEETIKEIRRYNKDVLIMQGAGITNGKDVEKLLTLGADGTGISSGIALSDEKETMIEELFGALKELK